jgi:membrane protease YdiL (CAAX protease family)
LLTDAFAVGFVAVVMGVSGKEIMQTAEALFMYLVLSSIFIVGLVVLFQRIHRRDDRLQLKFFPSRQWWKAMAIGLAFVPVFFLFMLVAAAAMDFLFPGSVLEENPVLQLVRTPFHLILFLISSVLAGGLREEVQRAFVINRSEVYFWSPWLGLGAWSIFFGLQHFAQGPAAILITAFLGFGFGWMYIRWKNILAPFISHACFNCLVLIFFWLGNR